MASDSDLRPSEPVLAGAPVEDSGAEDAPETSRSRDSLGSLARRASMFSMAAFGTSQVLRLAGNLILTRMLFEEAFGIMALVTVFLNGLTLLSDVGIGQCVIQSKRGDEPVFQNTAWTLQVTRGFVLCLIGWAAAIPLASLYDEPQLASLMPVTALTAVIAGFHSTKLFTQNRQLAMGRLAILEVGSQLLALISMIAWASVDRSPWALVCGAITLNTSHTLLTHLLLPGERNRLLWDRESARELFTFGRWIVISTGLSFLAMQSDRLIFGKLISMRELGIYNIALTAAVIPPTAFNRLADSVVFPVLSRLFDGGEEANRSFHDVRRPLVLGAGYMMAGIIAGGPVIIAIMYDDRFLEAGWMLRLLAIGGWFGILEYSLMSALLAGGLTRWIAAGASARLVSLIVLVPLGFHVGGFRLALIGFVLTDVVRFVVSMIGVGQLGIRSVVPDLQATVLVAVGVAAGTFASDQTANFVAPGIGGELLRALAVFVVVTLVYLPFGLRYLAEWRARRVA